MDQNWYLACMIAAPFNLHAWIEEHRHLLKPPVGNQQVYFGNSDYIVMVVGGPNARRDYHFNDSEELFYQLEGDVSVKIIEDGKPREVFIKEGEMWLLPGRVPHSPQRPAGTVGLVIERYRKPGEQDAFMWFCENCGNKLYEEFFYMTDIVKQLPLVMENFYSDMHLRTCSNCGTVMERA